jgi:hypothetical protein
MEDWHEGEGGPDSFHLVMILPEMGWCCFENRNEPSDITSIRGTKFLDHISEC